jgi:hypothetical protein
MAKNELFDLLSEHFLIYMEQLGDRATKFEWNSDVLGISNNWKTPSTQQQNLITC